MFRIDRFRFHTANVQKIFKNLTTIIGIRTICVRFLKIFYLWLEPKGLLVVLANHIVHSISSIVIQVDVASGLGLDGACTHDVGHINSCS